METFLYKDIEVKLTGRVAKPKPVKKNTTIKRRREVPTAESIQMVEVETIDENTPIRRIWVKEDELLVVQDVE